MGSFHRMDLEPLPITHQATIPESYLDSMGHMNVMWYTSLFGHATGGLFKLLSMDRAYFQSHQTGSFALEQHFRYLKEVRVGEHVTVRSRLLKRSERKFHVMHFMTKGDDQVLSATCEFLGAHIDMKIRRMSPFAPHIATNIDQMITEHAKLAWSVPISGLMRV